MALMSKCIVTKPSSFQEAVQDPTWVDAMVEEYDSIVKNSAISGRFKMDLQGKASY
jgi:hypothetical protein